MGIPPRRLTGLEPTTRTWVDAEGVTRSQPEPEWDRADRAIIAAWQGLNDRLCMQCGRPLALHRAEVEECAESDDPNLAAAGNYGVTFLTCPANLALDLRQAQQEKADEPARKAGRHPERARTWLTWRIDEGPPRFPDD